MRKPLTVLRGLLLAVSGITAQSQTGAPSGSANIPSGPSVTVELNSSIDSKRAKVGEKVEARTMEELKSGKDVLVPKGTKVIGHVREASARVKGDTESSLAIVFDKAVPKKEAEIPLNVMIVAVAAPAQATFAAGEPSPGSDPLANTKTGAQTSPMGSSRPQNPNAGSYPRPGLPDNAAAGPNAAGPLPANSRGIYGLKDLKLVVREQANAAATIITSSGKEVRLDGGTRLLLIAEAPASPALSGR